FLVVFIGYAGHLLGFGMHLNDMYYRYEPNVAINFTPVAIAVVLIGLPGAITDTALDIATSLHEVSENNKGLSFGELVRSGNNMGKDILGTIVNTLFFVFLGEIMAFFLAFIRNGYTFAEIINEPVFLQEITQLTVGCLGCVIIIPAVILIQSYIYSKGRPQWVLRSKTK
ncbi:MAG: YibE/F family protein, partial [Firmicutes bacterium]|nr:YibE/F family protein [Bacillota bacterium]